MREINLERAMGQYEFSVVPLSLLAANGRILHCQTKSNLMAIQQRTMQCLMEYMSLMATDTMNCPYLADHFRPIKHPYNI